MADNHTHDDDDNSRTPRLALLEAVDEAVSEVLPEDLAVRVEGHVETFAEHLREGLLAASTAVDLDRSRSAAAVHRPG